MMTPVSTLCTFLLTSHVMTHVVLAASRSAQIEALRGQQQQQHQHQQQHPGTNNCTTCRKIERTHFEPLKRVAIIKAEILRRLGYMQPPALAPPPAPKIPIDLPVPEVSPAQTQTQTQTQKSEHEYDLTDILSYSEAPDNFTDENIVQFKLSEGNTDRQLRVKSANLLIRVKCIKGKNRSGDKIRTGDRNRSAEKNRSGDRDRDSRNKARKRRRPKMVDLDIYTVNARGRPGDVIASVKSKLKKTKWLKLSLPEEVVQSAIDSNNKTLQVYVKCRGCGKRAKVILVHKRRKRRRANNKTASFKLHKRRPMLFLHTSVTASTGSRNKRSARVRQCDANSGTSCCKSNFVVDFESQEFGWENWIISPRRYRTAFCEGECPTGSGNGNGNAVFVNETRTCVPVRTRPLHLVYYNGEGAILQGVLPNMIVTKCGCR